MKEQTSGKRAACRLLRFLTGWRVFGASPGKLPQTPYGAIVRVADHAPRALPREGKHFAVWTSPLPRQTTFEAFRRFNTHSPAASAANAGGFLQTSLSEVTRDPDSAIPQHSCAGSLQVES